MVGILFAGTMLLRAQSTETVRLQDLDYRSMVQDWESARAGQSVDKNPIRIGGQTFADGIGTHAQSDLTLRLNKGATAFSSMVGVDDEKEGKGSVRFRIYVDGKQAADSGVMRGNDKPKQLTVNLKGAKTIRLVVEDAGDGIDSDHADWADAKFTILSGHKKDIKAAAVTLEPTMKIAMNPPAHPEINGARVVGFTPGKEFLFRIPATGKAPLSYKVEGLPAGLHVDEKRGIITGTVDKPGRFNVQVTVTGPAGKDSRGLQIIAGYRKLALTPPMGWNSWNVWGLNVDANKVRAAADVFIKSGLADAGYNYVNIDDGWEAGRSSTGEILTNNKFEDMHALTTYVHSLGLKMGIYSSPGPQTCGGYTGSWQHEYQDAKSYADWGIDYLKYDWCSYGNIEPNPDMAGLQKPYILMRNALDDSGRDIVFSLCQYGMGDVYNWGKQVGGNLWRTTGDINDSWNSMASIGFAHSEKAVGASPGGWNDPDMLVVGRLGWGSTRPTKLTGNEQITHISLWSLLAAPLMIGCDLTQLDPFTKALLTNHDVIEVDQDPRGRAATRVSKVGDTEVWARPLWDGSWAVGLFNRGPDKAKVRANWSEIARNLDASLPVRDLWKRKDLGSFTGGYATTVPAHGAVLIRIGQIEK